MEKIENIDKFKEIGNKRLSSSLFDNESRSSNGSSDTQCKNKIFNVSPAFYDNGRSLSGC